VIPTPILTPIPLAPSHVLGLANIRGEVYVIIDLVKKFKLQETKQQTEGKYFTVVLNQKQVKIGLQINTLPSTLSIQETQIDRQANLSFAESEVNQYINAIVKLPDTLLILLNEELLFQQDLAPLPIKNTN
jgi:purine-binding chemotaxis protein CheW